MSKRLLLFGLFLIYVLTSYGGIRSPDSEVVYQVSTSIATRGQFDVGPEYPWGFGLAPGLAGERYAIFGPAESVAAAPLVKVAIWLEPTRWYDRVPIPIHPSHYLEGSLAAYLEGEQPRDIAPHARRMFVALLFNSIVTTLSVAIFWAIVQTLTGSTSAAAGSSILLALGTLAWPYAGTFFSEPLATLFVLLAFQLLLHSERRDLQSDRRIALAGAGASLGVAVCTHITAILFVPFFLAMASGVTADFRKPSFARMTAFAGGLMPALMTLALFNYARFGNALETGRSVLPATASAFRYGTLSNPLVGGWGLLLSPGKGLLFYCPAVILGFTCWRLMHQRAPRLSWLLIGAAIFRFGFLSCRSDWHGGFSLGPRYMVMLVPFLILPVAFAFRVAVRSGSRIHLASLVAAVFVCSVQQFGFSLGEVFSCLHTIKLQAAGQGVNLLQNGAIYWLWKSAPLFHFLDGKRGPYCLSAIPLGNSELWIVGSFLLAIAALIGFSALLAESKLEKYTFSLVSQLY